tara:strand:+ start:1753 stop:3486 length:1734 start_codon:yes stop_codon:yes gene_type:complete
MNKRVFSLPINPKLSEDFVVSTFLPFLKKYKEYILDLYFTCRIPPFDQDAMGDTFLSPEALTESACYISSESDIPLSATFNNIWIRPDQKNLDLWIKEFAPIYNSGVRVVTLPHTSWVSTGQIQAAFPELFIKNTILREVTRPNEIVSLAEAGFNYINLDRDLMRDRDQLLRIRKAKDYCKFIGKPIMLSMLVNETCWGGCPIMPEHYQYNSTRTKDDPIFFASPISRVSCSTWDIEHPEADLKQANLPPWREDWVEMQELGIDTFKLHGRESMMRLQESMDLIRRWADKEEYMFPEYKKYQEQLKIKDSPIVLWREKIKTCKFDCWDCNYCEAVVQSHMKKAELVMHPQVETCIEAFNNSGKYLSNHRTYDPNDPSAYYNVEGLTSPRVRHFLNNLCSQEGAVYLEVGVYAGSTFCAAVQNNDMVAAYANDNWSQPNLQPAREDITLSLENVTVDTFVKNLQENITTETLDFDIQVLNGDSSQLGKKDFKHDVNVIFYDGDNDQMKMVEFFTNMLTFTQDVFTLVIDDANIEKNVEVTKQFLDYNGLKILYERELLNDPEDAAMWWNGLYVVVVSK